VSFGSDVRHGLALSYRKREMQVESHALLRQRHIMKLESTVDATEGLCRLRALLAALYVPAVLWFSDYRRRMLGK